MLKRILLFSILFIFLNCTDKKEIITEPIKLQQKHISPKHDTLEITKREKEIDIKIEYHYLNASLVDGLQTVAFFKGRFYLKTFNGEPQIYSINKKGNNLRTYKTNKRIPSTRYSFKINNDTLFLDSDIHYQYYLDEKTMTFIERDYKPLSILEDETYKVIVRDGRPHLTDLFFFNKEDSTTHVSSIPHPINACKIGSNYYFSSEFGEWSNPTSLFEIENPKNGKKSELNLKGKLHFNRDAVRNIFGLDGYENFTKKKKKKKKIYITSCLNINDSIAGIFSHNGETFIARIKGKKKLEKMYTFKGTSPSKFQHKTKNGELYLGFTSKGRKYSLLLVENGVFKFYHFRDK